MNNKETIKAVPEIVEKDYSTIKFVLRDDLDTESVMEIIHRIDFLKFCSKEFYIEKCDGLLVAKGNE